MHPRRLFATLAALGVLAALLAGTSSVAPARTAAAAEAPQVAATPPMGWNDWYTFFCGIDEQLIKQTADTMVSSGMKNAGYEYVNLDDCWMDRTRDADGNLRADPEKFPHGIAALADYVHARGLKLGVYEDVGTKTCAGYPGSYGHVQQDADTFASWGIDFVKVDWCNVPFGDFPGMSQQDVAKKLYTEYGEALRATGRPMVFSICEWNPALEPWTWAPAISNMWRTNNDYGDSWDRIVANLDREAPLAPYAGPGHWNDPDILQVGLGGMGTAQDRAHFSMWAMLAAPLLAGNDLRSMSEETRQILTNREVITLDQDPLGRQATRLSHDADADVWVKELAGGDRAVMLVNRGTTARTISTTARAVGLSRAGAYAVRDLWAHDTSESAGRIAASVPARSVVLYRVAPLRDEDVDAYPPATLVSVDAGVPPVYPGSRFRLAHPGQTLSASAAFRNDGRAAVTDAKLALAGPAGWAVDGAPVDGGTVPGGHGFAGDWQVTVPDDTSPGTYTLTGTATYRWGDGAHAATRQGQAGLTVVVPPAGSPYLSDLDWLSATNGYGPVLVDRSYWGGPLTIHGTVYQHGLWTNANAELFYYIGGNCSRFTVDLGLDDSDRGPGTVTYEIYTDGAKAYDSGVVTDTTPTLHVDEDVSGAQVLQVVVTDAGDGITYDNADLAAPRLTCEG